MSFLLDTNICSAHLRRPAGLSHRFTQHSGRLYISTVVLAELYAWAYHRPDPTPVLQAIAALLKLEVQVIGFDEIAAEQFGQLQRDLRQLGRVVATADLMIASVAIVANLTLVTNNTNDFQQIPGLNIVDWLTP